MNDTFIRMESFASSIRLQTLKMLAHRGFGHLGGSMSLVEALAVLYSTIHFDPTNPNWSERDYVILSKGHAGPALYATLALKGFFPLNMLESLNQNGTNLPSHPDRNLTPGIDVTTGSLGQGISVATGMALGLKRDKSTQNVYCFVGDGELNEGQCWEAIQSAAHFQLSNFTLFIDYNKKQLDGTTDEICCSFDPTEKLKSFGFEAQKVDGRSVSAIWQAMQQKTTGPKAIILDTVKGQGLPYFEQMEKNHHIRFDDKTMLALMQEIDRLEKETADVKL